MLLSPGLPATLVESHNKQDSPAMSGAMTQAESVLTSSWQFISTKISEYTALASPTRAASEQEQYAESNDTLSEGGLPEEEDVQFDPEDDDRDSHISVTTRPARTGRQFQLAHPPPSSRAKHKLKVRPRVLLQLRELKADCRPTPAVEVLPTIQARYCKREKILNTRIAIRNEDFIVVGCESYNDKPNTELENGGEGGEEEEWWNQKEIIAAVHQMSKSSAGTPDSASIHFNAGNNWTAQKLPNGSYEFTMISQHGVKTTARWVKKRGSKTRRRSAEANGNAADSRFMFSVLNPHQRQHPVIGSLDRTSLTLFNQYSLPSTKSATPMSLPSTPTAAAEEVYKDQLSYLSRGYLPEKQILKTADEIKQLMMVTGIWVSFAEGWTRQYDGHADPEEVAATSRRLSVVSRTGSDVSHLPRTRFSLRGRRAANAPSPPKTPQLPPGSRHSEEDEQSLASGSQLASSSQTMTPASPAGEHPTPRLPGRSTEYFTASEYEDRAPASPLKAAARDVNLASGPSVIRKKKRSKMKQLLKSCLMDGT